MSVVSVRARSFILALFIRDDGERFLLGDNGFDFKDSQLHFSANTIENDEVAKQGVDGVMLAGQVRRASVQSFDGYVGDATMLKEEIERMRREFFAFFASGHHFRVVYIDCNRNAWQRKGGYLVDAPEVKELWQIHPEYHVGLNFEDVNYYGYDENAEGEEILSNIISVPISSDVEGGLVWDENGAVSEPAVVEYDTETASVSGTNISISNAAAAPLSSFSISGNTAQNGTPTPDAPVAVQTVTGENVVKICGKNLLPYPYNFGTSATSDGITVTANSDGSITINGTKASSSTTIFFLRPQFWSYNETNGIIIPAGKTVTSSLKGAEVANGKLTMRSECYYADGTHDFLVAGASPDTATMRAKATLNARLLVYQGYTFDNLTVYPQIELGTATDYEPYQSQNYTISLGSIELCGLGDDGAGGYLYKDGIYKNLENNKWYVHKEIGAYTFDGTENWFRSGRTSASVFVAAGALTSSIIEWKPGNAYKALAKSNRFTASTATAIGHFDLYNVTDFYTSIALMFDITTIPDITAAKAWITANKPVVYGILATPTDTEITNEALITQLEAILSQGYTYAGTNNITTVISAGNVQGELEITYYTKYNAVLVGGGYVWEAGGEGGPTIVMNESISEVSPVWTVFGPALNPVLENTTTGEQIEYVGMIGEGQTLVVDMGEQTASLDGLNVISNIVGDYLTLAPGSNTLLFSAESAAPASQIGWSEIVG